MLEPSLQGKGLGKVFLREVLEALGEEGVCLDCWAGNEKLRGFYGECGFELIGVWPEEDYEIAVFGWRFGGDEGSAKGRKWGVGE